MGLGFLITEHDLKEVESAQDIIIIGQGWKFDRAWLKATRS